MLRNVPAKPCWFTGKSLGALTLTRLKLQVNKLSPNYET